MGEKRRTLVGDRQINSAGKSNYHHLPLNSSAGEDKTRLVKGQRLAQSTTLTKQCLLFERPGDDDDTDKSDNVS